MNEYLVIKIIEQEIYLYRIVAETANVALIKSKTETPFKAYHFNRIFGEGGVAIPYTTANVILTYVKLFFATAKVKSEKENNSHNVSGGISHGKTDDFVQ